VNKESAGVVKSYTIITTEANPLMSEIHNSNVYINPKVPTLNRKVLHIFEHFIEKKHCLTSFGDKTTKKGGKTFRFRLLNPIFGHL